MEEILKNMKKITNEFIEEAEKFTEKYKKKQIMEKIKVGEYARTDRGVIYEYTEEEKNDVMMQDFRLCNDGKIVKHSPNIIDLIEVGDYVNGKRVSTIQESKNTSNNIIIKELWCYFDLHFCSIIREDEIKDIVTKEMFNQVKYEV